MTVIGIDATALSDRAPGGIGTSQYETMREMAGMDSPHRFILYATKPLVIPFTDRPLDIEWPVRIGCGPSARSNILWMQTGVNRMLREDGVEVFWSPRHLLPLRARGIATVATIQDFWYRLYPEQQPWANRIATRVLMDRIVRSADVLVAMSAATAADLDRFCGAAHPPVRIVPPGVDADRFRQLPTSEIGSVLERLRLTKPYLLAMDVYNPRKNASVILEACGELVSEGRDLDVVCLGQVRGTAREVDILGLAACHGLGGRVHLVGDVPADVLVALYGGAQVFVYPSVYEGFGMPVLEAMACGCPVVTSDRSSLPEAAGDAAILLAPDDAKRIASAIRSVLDDSAERERLVSRGLARAKTFTWRRTAHGMIAAIEKALSHVDGIAQRAGTP